MDMTICGKNDLNRINKKYDTIISINNPDKGKYWDLYNRDKWKKELEKKGTKVLCLYFDDATLEDRPMNKNTLTILPNKSHIERIMEIGKNVEGSILIHCQLGISRSTAAGMIILMDRLNISEEEAKKEIITIRSCACPNPYMLELYHEIKIKSL